MSPSHRRATAQNFTKKSCTFTSFTSFFFAFFYILYVTYWVYFGNFLAQFFFKLGFDRARKSTFRIPDYGAMMVRMTLTTV